MATKLEDNLRSGFSQNLSLIETILYAAVSVLLGAAAVSTLVTACVKLWQGFQNRASPNYGILILDELLLVLMLIELLHTVRISIRTQALTVAPFLIVGLIATIRRVLVITMQVAEKFVEPAQAAAQETAFRNSMIELGLLGFLILVFVASIYFVSRAARTEDMELE